MVKRTWIFLFSSMCLIHLDITWNAVLSHTNPCNCPSLQARTWHKLSAYFLVSSTIILQWLTSRSQWSVTAILNPGCSLESPGDSDLIGLEHLNERWMILIDGQVWETLSKKKESKFAYRSWKIPESKLCTRKDLPHLSHNKRNPGFWDGHL